MATPKAMIRSLIRLGLVDEYRLMVLPVAAGAGTPLFTDLARPVALRLVTSTAFPSGILELVYSPPTARTAYQPHSHGTGDTMIFASIGASDAEKNSARPGDTVVAPADVVMDRAFTVDAPIEAVWPWLLQLGKRRAGWYLPRRVERFLPRSRRASRSVNPAWLNLKAGDVIPDYGGRDETFEVAEIRPPASLVYRSRRGHTSLTWSLTLESVGRAPDRTRVFLRLRMAPVRYKLLARTAGELLDQVTVAGMAAGLRERLAAS
jgi:hypothetical protein